MSLNNVRTNSGNGRCPPRGSWLRSLASLGERARGCFEERTIGSQRPWLDHYPNGVPAELAYPHQCLGWLLRQAAERFPARVACRYYDEQLTYEQLHEQAQRLAAVLVREGLQRGDRVGVLLPNLPETLVSLFATWMAGGIVVSLSPLMVAHEVESLMKATGCRFVITLDILSPLVCQGEIPPQLVLLSSLAGRLQRLERLGYAWVRFQRIGFSSVCRQTSVLPFEEAVKSVIRQPIIDSGDTHDPAFILPTGGTTGKPKAVTLSHHNLIAQAWQLSHWSRGHHGEETILAVLPFFHSYGLSVCVMMGLSMGATLLIQHRFRPASVARLIESRRPTVFVAVPAMLAALDTHVLHHKACDFRSIRWVISGGAPLSATVAERFQEHSGASVVEGYGLSEAGPVTHVGPLDGTAVPGTIGLPISDTDARIVDPVTGTECLPAGAVGELIVRGPQVMLGYWDSREATDEVIRDGWLYTGDLATQDERGFFTIVDRKKDLIITSGFNVYPTDVEETLRTYPGVKEIAIVGAPDEERGEVVKAVLVVESRKDFHRRDFDAFARLHLAAHKRPQIIEVRDDALPRNFLGKLLRRELRQEQEKSVHEVASSEKG
ncbi:MAG: AMP-binding protein [Pirellulaceae bacterium]